MTITVAGNKKEYEDGLKLTELIEKEDIESPEYVTVTINDEFISKALRRIGRSFRRVGGYGRAYDPYAFRPGCYFQR